MYQSSLTTTWFHHNIHTTALSNRFHRAVMRAEEARLAIDFSTGLRMRLACVWRTRRVRNDNFSSTTYRD